MHTEIQLFHKERLRTTLPSTPSALRPSPVCLSLGFGRLRSNPQHRDFSLWELSPYQNDAAGLLVAALCSELRGGMHSLLRALLGVRRCREALAWGILGPFWPADLDMSPFLPILALGHAWRSGAEPFWGSATLGSAVNVIPGLPLRTPRALGCVWAAVLPRAVRALLCATRPALQACCCAGPAAAVPCTFSPGRIRGWDAQSCPLPPRSNASLAGQK